MGINSFRERSAHPYNAAISAVVPADGIDIDNGEGIAIPGELTAGVLPVQIPARQQKNISFRNLVTEIELYNYLHQSPTIDIFTKRIQGLLQSIGIYFWSHTVVNMIVDALDPFGLYSDLLVKQYAREEFHRDDLIIRHMLASDKPLFEHRIFDFITSSPLEGDLISRNLELHKLLREHGMMNMFAIPTIDKSHRAVFTIWTKKNDPPAFESNILRNLNSLLMLAKTADNIGRRKFSSRFHGDKFNSAIPINLKPLELLRVLATKDLTLNEAATVLNINISTANQHIAAAKKAFGTTTIHGTIIAAMQHGYIILTNQ